jgi:hypothetical protein
MSGQRVLYVPNEAGDFRQVGFRRPFADLVSNQVLGAVSIFSLQLRIKSGGDPEQHRQDLIERVRKFRPTIILMQHLGATGLRKRHFTKMRAAADFDLIYHEGDPYSKYLHPLPLSARAAGKASDVVFTVGTGDFADNFRLSGSRDVRFAPSSFDPERFRSDTSENREHDVVIVANRNMPRYRGHPNWRDRIAFVQYMQQRFEGRIAVYGKGWEGPGARGPVDFSKQDEAIKSAWVTANWDHYAGEASYFSNRLPISLASGSIHATTEHPEYDRTFADVRGDFLMFERTFAGLADTIESLLERTTTADRLAIGARARAYAFKNCRQDDQLVTMLNYSRTIVDPSVARAVWDLGSVPLMET